jgi:hypothetical protein
MAPPWFRIHHADGRSHILCSPTSLSVLALRYYFNWTESWMTDDAINLLLVLHWQFHFYFQPGFRVFGSDTTLM